MIGEVCAFLHCFVIYTLKGFIVIKKTLREDAQTAEMELIAVQYRGRARVLQAKLFVISFSNINCVIG